MTHSYYAIKALVRHRYDRATARSDWARKNEEVERSASEEKAAGTTRRFLDLGRQVFRPAAE